MLSPENEPDLQLHHARYPFYYERASKLETMAMNTVCFLNICLTIAVHGNRNFLPPEVLEALEKTTNVVEVQFMEVVGIIRDGPAFRALTDAQRAAMETGCLTIRFHEANTETWNVD